MFIGNNIAVDFVNTEVVSRGQIINLLPEGNDLVRWAAVAKLDIVSQLQQAEFAAALELRLALKSIFVARIDNRPASRDAIATINRYMANTSARQILQFKQNTYILEQAEDALTIPVLLGYLALQGATLLASSQAERLKRCSNPDCVLIFVDTSRSQKRRWCSMETCGNRAKVSRHYHKQHS